MEQLQDHAAMLVGQRSARAVAAGSDGLLLLLVKQGGQGLAAVLHCLVLVEQGH